MAQPIKIEMRLHGPPRWLISEFANDIEIADEPKSGCGNHRSVRFAPFHKITGFCPFRCDFW
jgi:hypothetical protein